MIYLPLGAAPLPVAPLPVPLPAGAPGVLTGGPPLVPGPVPVRIEPLPPSIAFSELLFTEPGLFMLPVALPPPAAVWAPAAPENASVRAAAKVSVFIDMVFLQTDRCDRSRAERRRGLYRSGTRESCGYKSRARRNLRARTSAPGQNAKLSRAIDVTRGSCRDPRTCWTAEDFNCATQSAAYHSSRQPPEITEFIIGSNHRLGSCLDEMGRDLGAVQ